MWYKQLSFPIILTLIRLVVSPIILPFFLVYLLPCNNPILNGFLCIQFLCFALTDFFDGYLARKYNQSTLLGAVLDPIADKFLLYSVLVALVAAGKLYFFWAIILIGREFFIMGLRQIALEQNFSVPVSSYGKSKTAVQIAALALVIANPYHAQHDHIWNVVEMILLILATILSVISAVHYSYFFCRRYNEKK